jgi:mono/diheme cytochrome c family protein
LKPAILVLALIGAVLPAHAMATAIRFELPEGPGRGLIYGNCQTCHDLQSVVDSAGIPGGAWNAVLDNMREFGLRIDDLQRSKILEYLSSYLGPNPPAPAPDTREADQGDSARIFLDVCAACHQEDGTGKEHEFPPLAGNTDLFLERTWPAKVVINGLEGKLEVEGKTFDKVMPPFDFLTDEEIASAINYARSQWGNDKLAPADMAPLTAADVAKVRENPIPSEEVHAERQSLLP